MTERLYPTRTRVLSTLVDGRITTEAGLAISSNFLHQAHCIKRRLRSSPTCLPGQGGFAKARCGGRRNPTGVIFRNIGSVLLAMRNARRMRSGQEIRYPRRALSRAAVYGRRDPRRRSAVKRRRGGFSKLPAAALPSRSRKVAHQIG